MVHGKWYRGIDDLSPIGKDFTPQDTKRWHLHITQNDITIGYCALERLQSGWHLINMEYASPLALDLVLRQVRRKLETFGECRLFAGKDENLIGFGFKYINEDTMKAEPIILPVYCKE